MNFGHNSEINYEGSDNISVYPPDVYIGGVLDQNSPTLTKNDKGRNIINFAISGAKDSSGKAMTAPMQHSEFDPNDPEKPYDNLTDEEKAKQDTKATNLVARVGYMLWHLLQWDSKEQHAAAMATNRATSFETYHAWIVQLCASRKHVPVKFKTIGSVWEGKAKSGFPGYKGFITGLEEPLSFSAGELKGNNEYFAATSAGPNTANTNGGTPDPAQGVRKDNPFA